MDCWNFLKKFAVTDLNETAEKAKKEAYEIFEKHGKTKFARNLIAEMINELDRICRKNK